MRKYSKNKKIVSLMVSFLATTLILTGTFAWSVRLFSTIGGLGEDYHYIVKLLDIDTDPLFMINNWESDTLDKLDKKVYATSSYNVADIKKQYNDIIAKDSNAIFRDTWVRIKLEETFMRNGSTKTDIVTELNEGKLISSFDTYFSLDSNDVDMITLDTWVENLETPGYEMHGRFWILDTESGWLYWAQPLLATTELGDSDSEIEDQTTDHIIDEVSLIKQPAGVWEYTIKATLEAMDVELQGYEEEGAWNDIDESHAIYSLFAIEEDSLILTSPIIVITNNTVSWNSIKDATKYEVYVDGILIGETIETSYDLTNYAEIATSKQVQVKAIADGVVHIDSTMSVAAYLDTPLPFTETYFPDAAFRTFLQNTSRQVNDDWDPSYIEDGGISPRNLALVTKINASNNQLITGVKGIEYFPNLVELRLSSMPLLVTVDVSSNLKLQTLYSNGNRKQVFVILGNKPELFYLHVSGNALSKLDISGCTILIKTNTTYFTYNPQWFSTGVQKTLKTTVNASTKLIEWQ